MLPRERLHSVVLKSPPTQHIQNRKESSSHTQRVTSFSYISGPGISFRGQCQSGFGSEQLTSYMHIYWFHSHVVSPSSSFPSVLEVHLLSHWPSSVLLKGSFIKNACSGLQLSPKQAFSHSLFPTGKKKANIWNNLCITVVRVPFSGLSETRALLWVVWAHIPMLEPSVQ